MNKAYQIVSDNNVPLCMGTLTDLNGISPGTSDNKSDMYTI